MVTEDVFHAETCCRPAHAESGTDGQVMGTVKSVPELFIKGLLFVKPSLSLSSTNIKARNSVLSLN